MGGRLFVWIWSWWWLATSFGFEICRRYFDIREIFPWNHDFVGQTGTILGWCRPETKCGKNSVDHNASSATTIFDYFDWSSYQGKGEGNGSQMVGLYAVCSRFQKCNSGYWLPFTVCESSIFCQQMDFFEPKCIHQKQIEILQCHRDTNRLFWSWAPMHPQCRYGQTWYQLSTYDPKRGWSSKRDLLGRSVARNFAYLESTCARSRGSISHENMGRNLRFWTLEICLPYHESPSRTLGTPDATLATFWKRTFGTSSNELDDQIWTIFSIKALAWLEGGGYRCWPVDDGGGQFHQILYTVVEFVSQVVYILGLFVLVRALKWAAFSACELRLRL